MCFRLRRLGLADDLCNHRIHFPIAEPGAAGHDGRTFHAGHPVAELATTTVGLIALAAVSLKPQMAIPRPLGPLMVEDMLVNPFMADRRTLPLAQPATDRLGIPLFLQQAVDAVPRFHRNTPSSVGVSPT
jgi:hypothetical protein